MAGIFWFCWEATKSKFKSRWATYLLKESKKGYKATPKALGLKHSTVKTVKSQIEKTWKIVEASRKWTADQNYSKIAPTTHPEGQ